MWQKKHARKSAEGRSARGPMLPKSNRNFRQPPYPQVLLLFYKRCKPDHLSVPIIATSHDLTPKGSLVREIPLFQEFLGW